MKCISSLSAVFVLFLVSCASSQKPILKEDKIKTDKTYGMLQVVFKGPEQSTQISFFSPQGGRLDISVEKTDHPEMGIVFEIPNIKEYYLAGFQGGGSRYRFNKGEFPAFTPKPGMINHLGVIVVTTDKYDSDLWVKYSGKSCLDCAVHYIPQEKFNSWKAKLPVIDVFTGEELRWMSEAELKKRGQVI